MKQIVIICIMAGAVSVVASPCLAESGIYFGTGFSYRLMSSHRFKDEKRYVQRKRAAHDMVLGYRIEKGLTFYGPEINVERFLRGRFADMQDYGVCKTVQYGSYFCSRRSTYRLRGIYGRKLEHGLEAYVALGIGVMKGYGATGQGRTSLGASAGITAGVGLQIPVSTRGMLRGEITYDNFNVVIRHPKGPDGTTYSPSYEETRLKLSYIFAF